MKFFTMKNLFKTFAILLFFLSFSSILIAQKTTRATSGGFWLYNLFNNVTWTNGIPAPNDRVIIGSSLTINGGGDPLTLKTLIINEGAVLNYSNQLTITDSLIILGNSSLEGTFASQSGAGPYSFNNIIFNATNPELGNFTSSGTTSITITGNIIKNSASNLSLSTGTTVNYTGSSNQDVIGSGYILNINKPSGTAILNNAFSSTGAHTITSGTLDLNGFGFTGPMTVNSGGTLIIPGASAAPTGTLTLNDGSRVEYTGTKNIKASNYYDLHVSGGGTLTALSGTQVRGIATVDGATLACGTGNLTVVSNASGTGAIGEITGGGGVTGSPVVQRYVSDMSVAGNPGWWYFLGAPVNGQTISNLNTTATTTGFTGSDFPSSTFNNVQQWDPNTSQYVGATNVTNSMAAGSGYFVYMGSSDPTYDIPITVGWQGTVNTGNYSAFSISGTAGHYSSLANPYPSAVVFSLASMPNSQVQNPYVVNNNGSFLALTDGSTLGLGQGFYIEASGSSPSLTFRESDKLGSVEANTVFNKNSKANNNIPKRLTVEITTVDGEIDFSYLQLDETKTLGMDYPADFDKYENFNGFTNVFFKQNGHNVHINNMQSNIGAGLSIPIHLSRAYPNGANVNLPFRVLGVQDFRDAGLCLSIENMATGATTPLTSDFSTTITWNENDTMPIFTLHFSKAFEESTTDATCYGFEDGSIEAITSTTAKYDFVLTNLIGDTLQSSIGKVGINHTFNNLKAGKYKVWVKSPNSCGTISKTVEVAEPAPVVSFFTVQNSTIDLSVNPTLQFNNFSANAQSFIWDFGDGNNSIDQNPVHTFSEIGNYNVELIAQNGACADTSYKTLKVENNHVGLAEIDINKNINIQQRNEKVEVRFNLNQREKVSAKLVNVLGQEVWTSQGDELINEQLLINLPQPNTPYILNIVGESFEANYKFIRQ